MREETFYGKALKLEGVFLLSKWFLFIRGKRNGYEWASMVFSFAFLCSKREDGGRDQEISGLEGFLAQDLAVLASLSSSIVLLG